MREQRMMLLGNEQRDHSGKNKRTAEYIGGGALLDAINGAIGRRGKRRRNQRGGGSRHAGPDPRQARRRTFPPCPC
jgi:hypothetical protein